MEGGSFLIARSSIGGLADAEEQFVNLNKADFI